VPPGTFRLKNVPIAGGKYAAVLGATDGNGETKNEYANMVVISDQPLTWGDLGVAVGQ